MRIFCFILFIHFFSSIVDAQQPSHFILGEEQFKGIQIYDVIQDKDYNYWFATNEGLYCFNGVSYERVECKNAKSNSAFNFVIDKNGTIYCHNLNNQIFKIKDKKCTLFYELSEVEGGSDVSLALDNADNILVSAKEIVVLNKGGKVIQRFKNKTFYIGPPFTTVEGVIIYHLYGADSLLVFSDESFKFKQFKNQASDGDSINVLKFFMDEDRLMALDLKSKSIFEFDIRNSVLIQHEKDTIYSRSESVRVYDGEKGFWVASTKPGIIFVNKIGNRTPQEFYSSYFISDVFEDKEGNILISTFDKGVLVIPDIHVPDVINSFRDDPVTSLYSNSDNHLILGTSKGHLLKYNQGKLSVLKNTGKRPIEHIKGHPQSKWLFFDDGTIRLYNTATGKTLDVLDASLKDAVFVTQTEIYLGTNRGIYKVLLKGKEEFEIEIHPDLNSRVHFMEYDPIHNLVYISTANGLIILDRNGKTKTIQYQATDIFPNDIHYSNGIIYLSTKEFGLLLYKKDEFIRKIIPKINDVIQVLKKIYVYNGTIIAKAANGFYQFDENGKYIRSLSSLYGFSSGRVIDYTFHKGKLWVSHSGGVQEIDLNYRSTNRKVPRIHIDRILVNDKSIPIQDNQTFDYDKRKFQFYFSAPTLRNRGTIQFHYRLLGLENKWTTSDFNVKQVSYNALAPGKYTFQIRIENQGEFSEIHDISFTITSPIYFRWWFIVLVGLVFIGIVFGIYRWQLSLQRKKSERINELKASKLTAIQSQMNPHFIFNSLNSIQDLILKGDVEHSYSYITTFSNLVRRTLSYSEKDFIDFEQEYKLLELYLSLEKLRFKKDLNYTIELKGIEDVMIPPLLVQPFIENSLIHGLLHKEGPKNLKITFELKDVLICTIEDNGIGREASRLIKKRQRSEHESFSGKAIQHRFEILSSVFDGQFGYHYEDIAENGIAKGTRVVLNIPFKPKF